MKIKTALALVAPAALLSMSFAAPAAAPAAACPLIIQGDMNGDGICNVTDLVLFNTAWNSGNLKADWNFDCKVDVADIVRFTTIIGPNLNSAHSIMDYNLDGNVDIADFVSYLADYNAGSSLANVSNRYDGQWDCNTNIADLTLWTNWYFNC